MAESKYSLLFRTLTRLAGAPVERSLLALAAYYGSKEAVAHLLAFGADPNLPSANDGMTSLHSAAAGESMQTVEIIHLLLAHGADRGALDNLGRIPVDILMQQQQEHAASCAQTTVQQQQQQQLQVIICATAVLYAAGDAKS